jgi:ABC-type antimicrobial peptide transport system permease subunit
MLAGLILAAGLNELLTKWTEAGSRDPFMLLSATLVLAFASELAGFVPSRRASRIDPIEALRYE